MSLLQFAGLVIAVTFILYAAWRIGFEDGRTFTKREGAMTISRIIESAQSGAALEEAQKQKEQNEKGADK